MMMADDQHSPLSARVDQLFDTFHALSEPEKSMDDVAESMSKALGGRPVTAQDIADLRSGTRDEAADSELLTALARYFDVPPEYLLRSDGDVAVASFGQQLRLLAAMRNAGMRHMDLRGSDVDIEALIERLSEIAKQPPPHQPPEQPPEQPQ